MAFVNMDSINIQRTWRWGNFGWWLCTVPGFLLVSYQLWLKYESIDIRHVFVSKIHQQSIIGMRRSFISRASDMKHWNTGKILGRASYFSIRRFGLHIRVARRLPPVPSDVFCCSILVLGHMLKSHSGRIGPNEFRFNTDPLENPVKKPESQSIQFGGSHTCFCRSINP